MVVSNPLPFQSMILSYCDKEHAETGHAYTLRVETRVTFAMIFKVARPHAPGYHKSDH